jgi:2'-5' RNA ligase
MQVSGITMPGYRVYEYLIVLDPHEELRNRINEVKKEFSEKYKASTVPKAFGSGKPHVTLVNFVQYELMEERLVNRLKTIAMGYYPIKVELKDYGSFPSHTIYINVTSKLPVQNLVKEIRTQAQRLMKLNDDNKPHFILEPYIPIARKLVPWQYEKSWLEYSNKHFTGRFIADGMLLLKRPAGENDLAYGQAGGQRMKYQVVERFQFQNLPVVTRQGDLFM